MATIAQLESLRQALSFDRAPFCSGAISPPPEGLYLYYGKEDPKFINFASATSEDVDLLLAACDPATFGRGKEDVYDESYRKAVKMDASNFSVPLNLGSSGLMRVIEEQFLQLSDRENKYIRSELYKLNIYGKDSFFKAHKDTPRGTDMLGSLVVIYPTPHEGGELVLRHKDDEWKFDASSLTATRSNPSLAYVAFYSDIEHEVLKVTSGRRVTITYNLYLVDSTSEPKASAVTPSVHSLSNLRKVLQGLLKSPEFLPYGGTFGFGLAHLYPVSPETNLQQMVLYLKGEDAHVYHAFRELQFRPSLRMIYDDEQSGPDYGVMLNRIVMGPTYNYERNTYAGTLVNDFGGVSVNKTENTSVRGSYWVRNDDREGEYITWITPFNGRNRLQDVCMAYGNEVTAGYVYCSPCLIVRIAPAGERV